MFDLGGGMDGFASATGGGMDGFFGTLCDRRGFAFFEIDAKRGLSLFPGGEDDLYGFRKSVIV